MTDTPKEKPKEELIEKPVEIVDEKVVVVDEVRHYKQGMPMREKPFDREKWQPKTAIGKKVKSGEIKDIDTILDNGMRIMEAEIVDALFSNLTVDLLAVGQSKGKFGGGKRSIWRQTQKKTAEGNKPHFSAVAVIGNKDGYVGVGLGKAKETVPAREKATRQAKINMIKIRRGCGSWECGCKTSHSIPFKVKGRCGSVTVELLPAPRGTNLCVEKECSKIMALAGIKDLYANTYGSSRTKLNTIKACMAALTNLSQIKIKPEYIQTHGIKEGNK